MRVGTIIAACGLLAWAATPARAHPGHAAVVVNVGQLRYAGDDVTVSTGDAVGWVWKGPDTNHSVTADDGSFDSDPGKSAAQVSHPSGDGFTFVANTPRVVTYHCKVHPTMHGTVRVVEAPAPPPGSQTGEQPRPDPPRITRVRASMRPGYALLRFRLSAAADLRATVRRLRDRRVVRRVRFSAPAGNRRRLITLFGLRAGRYRITLTGTDPVSGLPARAVSTNVRVGARARGRVR